MKVEANKDYSGTNRGLPISCFGIDVGDSIHKNFLMVSERYFEALNEKDVQYLSHLYHPNVELHDWNGSWYDSPVVLQMNEGLFEDGLEFELEFSNQIGRITYNHILIHTNKETIKVLDVIYWNDDFKITKIEAFKG
jgi:hypothetical protein